MSDSDETIFASDPFKFIVGGKSFYVHSALVAKHSKTLDCIMHGDMSEAQEGKATLDEVDEGTFVRFSRWAYNGYYSPAAYSLASESRTRSPISEFSKEDEGKPSQEETVGVLPAQPSTAGWGSNYATIPEPYAYIPKTKSVEKPAEVYEPLSIKEDFNDGWDAFSKTKGDKKKKGRKSQGFAELAKDAVLTSPVFAQQQSPKSALKESFIELKYAVMDPHPGPPPPRSNRGSYEDYTEVFLSHARLYVFAEKYDIQPLKALAIQQLHQTLATYTLYPERVGDIVELLRYVYANTADADVDDGIEDLRAMLVHYIGFEMDMLVEAPEFKELLLENEGALLGDFLGMVGKRIRT